MLRRFHRWTLAACVPLVLLGLKATDAAPPETAKTLEQQRHKMVADEIEAAGVKNKRVLESMRNTPRHEFVPPNLRHQSYFDMALPIGESQTISPPFVVAYMTESLDPQPTDKVLEIGTGSGYQAAVLAPLVKEVYSIEIVPQLGKNAAKVLKKLHYDNVFTKVGDGYQGWTEHAPFDKIIVTCSPEKAPPKLVEQLKEGGRMVIPVGERYQQTLYLMKKVKGELVTEELLPTLFVPMTGKAEQGREVLPDPAHPTIFNGDFEATSGDPPQLVGWYYVRQMQIEKDKDAPDGKQYITFSNREPGRAAHTLQGLGIDGRKVEAIDLSVMVRARDLRPGQNRNQMPMIQIMFYDENRATIAIKTVGPWRDSFDWQRETARIEVPPRAREAILSIGMMGATGEISFDSLSIQAAAGKKRPGHKSL